MRPRLAFIFMGALVVASGASRPAQGQLPSILVNPPHVELEAVVNGGLASPLFVGDFCTGKLWFARSLGGGLWSGGVVLDTAHNISSFGEDEDGNVYLVAYGGSVFRVASN